MIQSTDKYIMTFHDYDTNAYIEINKLQFYREASKHRFVQLVKLASSWLYFDLCETMADDIKELMRNINFYFGGSDQLQKRLYARLYSELKYLEKTYLIDMEDFTPELAIL